MVSEACKYSFDDLYQACFERPMAEDVKIKLYALSQKDRNAVVGEWAQKANWKTKDIVGQGGVVYRSFWPGI